MGLSITTPLKRKSKVSGFSKKQSAAFFKLLSDLLKNGFSISDSFSFMKKTKVFSDKTITFLINRLEQGEELAGTLAVLGFSEEIITQIEFAQRHGDLSFTLKGIEEHMQVVQKQKENTSKILLYPMILLVFLFVALIGMRQFLLPQLELSGLTVTDNLGVQVIKGSPYYLCGVIAVFLFTAAIFSSYLNKRTSLERARIFARIPVFRSYYIQYTSAFFALEWGKLFAQGMEIKQIIGVMKQLSNQSLMKELAGGIEEKLIEGKPFYDQLEEFSFLAEELAAIIQQGEVKGNLGKELMIYSSLCRERFFTRVEKIIQWIQPIIFLVIALAVVSVYGAMLLPIYGGIENI